MTHNPVITFFLIVGLLLVGWIAWSRRGSLVGLRTFDRIFGFLLAATVGTAGVALIVASFLWRVPKTNDLIEHQERLLSYYVLHQSNLPWFPGNSKTWYDVVWYTSEGGKYFSESLNEQVAAEALEHRGALVQFYMRPNQRTHTLENGEHALPTYGLSVDGREIQSVASALAQERGLVRLAFPVLGLVLIAIACGIMRRHTPSPNKSLEPTSGRSVTSL